MKKTESKEEKGEGREEERKTWKNQVQVGLFVGGLKHIRQVSKKRHYERIIRRKKEVKRGK